MGGRWLKREQREGRTQSECKYKKMVTHPLPLCTGRHQYTGTRYHHALRTTIFAVAFCEKMTSGDMMSRIAMFRTATAPHLRDRGEGENIASCRGDR